MLPSQPQECARSMLDSRRVEWLGVCCLKPPLFNMPCRRPCHPCRRRLRGRPSVRSVTRGKGPSGSRNVARSMAARRRRRTDRSSSLCGDIIAWSAFFFLLTVPTMSTVRRRIFKRCHRRRLGGRGWWSLPVDALSPSLLAVAALRSAAAARRSERWWWW